ncbi:hypothetical protein [Rhodoplanes sp. SY1]|uniref:hypothetical protein n=1 Tax=Rhodoplanes sp. SY1 TaxID=3166646 RepID=UPI0038B67C7C
MLENLLPGVPSDRIEAIYGGAPGNEIDSGKFASSESSAALVANTFGFFIHRWHLLPPLPGTERDGWPATAGELEQIVRFPWRGGRHPCLDVLLRTTGALIGIESKRYEPFRSHHRTSMSSAFLRPVWGDRMKGYQMIRDDVRGETSCFRHLDAGQLVKHALALRHAAKVSIGEPEIRPVLVYLYSEPDRWMNSDRRMSPDEIMVHRREVRSFADLVAEDEVRFVPLRYADLLDSWSLDHDPRVRDHAAAVRACFQV